MWDLFPHLRSPSLRGCPRPPRKLFLGRELCEECIPPLERMLGLERTEESRPAVSVSTRPPL